VKQHISLCFSKYTMSSTLRLFLNDNRISTAVTTKSGNLLQVFPVKKQFADEVVWRQHWDEAMKPKIILKIGYPGDEEEEKKVAPSPVAPVAAARPSRSKTTIPASDFIFNTLAQQAKAKPQQPKPKWSRLSDWTVSNKDKHFEHTLPAGKYYIGDLCYVLGEDVYDDVFGGTGYSSGIYEEKGTDRTFLVSHTSWGDGEFPGSDGKKFAVDSGTIGICSTSLMVKDDGGGHLYTFEKPVKCEFRAGLFSFSWGYETLDIDTTGDDDAY
jgi:hypothetical protein